MMLTSFRANPHQGHLNHAKRIYSYCYKYRRGAIRLHTEEPDYPGLPDKQYEWEHSIYGGAEELLPNNAPAPFGKPVVMTIFVDANL
jgi:hypothetical protein